MRPDAANSGASGHDGRKPYRATTPWRRSRSASSMAFAQPRALRSCPFDWAATSCARNRSSRQQDVSRNFAASTPFLARRILPEAHAKRRANISLAEAGRFNDVIEPQYPLSFHPNRGQRERAQGNLFWRCGHMSAGGSTVAPAEKAIMAARSRPAELLACPCDYPPPLRSLARRSFWSGRS